MKRSNRRSVASPLAMILVSWLLGCGSDDTPDLGDVEGTVTLDNQPLADARVVFQPENGRPSVGTTDADGHYVAMYTHEKEGAKVGNHTVTISTYHAADPDAEDAAKRQETPERVPAQYNHETTLKAEVKPGSNPPFDFSLESNGKVLQPEDIEQAEARDASGC